MLRRVWLGRRNRLRHLLRPKLRVHRIRTFVVIRRTFAHLTQKSDGNTTRRPAYVKSPTDKKPRDVYLPPKKNRQPIPLPKRPLPKRPQVDVYRLPHRRTKVAPLALDRREKLLLPRVPNPPQPNHIEPLMQPPQRLQQVLLPLDEPPRRPHPHQKVYRTARPLPERQPAPRPRLHQRPPPWPTAK